MSKGVLSVFMLALFSLALLAIGPVLAQTSLGGKLVGRVTDEQGTTLPGVVVEAVSPSLLGKASAVADADGAFRLMALPSGVYEISFTAPGFK